MPREYDPPYNVGVSESEDISAKWIQMDMFLDFPRNNMDVS